MSNIVLIISGNNDRGIIASCRYFTDKGICFYIVSSGKKDLINFTDYKSKVICQREDRVLSVENFEYYKSKISDSYDRIIILPSSEYLNRFLFQNRNELETIGYIIPLIDDKTYSEISDKYSFGILCQNKGINIPAEYHSLEEAELPFVAKPKFYFKDGKSVNEKPFLVYDQQDLELVTQKSKSAEYYYQEFIGGKSFYLLYYFDKNQNYQVFSQQNLIQQDQGLSIIGAISSDLHLYSIASDFAYIFIEKKFRGLIMVEVKLYNDKIYMIEANPRLWGPSQLILDSGMSLFDCFAVDYEFIEMKEPCSDNYKEGVKYFWSGGIVKDASENKSLSYHQYSDNRLVAEYDRWMQNDIYLRKDTFELYLKEIKNKDI